jgi:trimeric autotransporter adhesin
MSSKRKSFLISHRGNMDSLRSFIKLCSLALPIALISMTGCGSLAPTTKTTKSLNSISVTPSNPSIAINATEQFTATGNYNDRSTADLSSAATWASSNQADATMNGTGVATGMAAGSTTITASVSGVTGSTTLTVMAATVTVTSITVSPTSQSITAGATQQFTATATYSNG